MAAYVIAQVEITDPDGFEQYRQMVPATIAAFGGRYVVRGGRSEALEGDWLPSRLVIIEFDSLDQARAWWASEDYAAAKDQRLRSARTNLTIVEGV